MNYEIIIIPNSTNIANKACGISMPCKKPLLLKVLQKSLRQMLCYYYAKHEGDFKTVSFRLLSGVFLSVNLLL